MKTKLFGVIALTLPLFLVGCATTGPSTESQGSSQGPSTSITSSTSEAPEASTNSESPSASDSVADGDPVLLTEAEVYEVVERSYLLFEERGMTERVISEGEEFVLLFDPEQPDYQAAWFNLDTGESELIFETDYFTLFVAYLMLDVPGHEIEIVPGGFVLSAPEWNPIEYTVKDGYLTGAKGVEFDWVATFDYSVDVDLVPGLKTLAAELIESFEE
jgi:hypothetical protein